MASLLPLPLIVCLLVGGDAGATPPAAAGTRHLLNGRDLDGWYTFLKERGRDNDPKRVFTVKDGTLRISGQEWGCLTTVGEYENYHLVVEFQWGDETFPPRAAQARDSGVLVHSVGADGAYGGTWMYGIECQMIEGGTGDLLVVGDGSQRFAITCPVAPERQGSCYVFQPDGHRQTIHAGRINWYGRDPDWQDRKGFRGRQDREAAVGQWNRYECLARDGEITLILNGAVVNQARGVQPRKGRIQIQSEGAEVFFRRVDLVPLVQHCRIMTPGTAVARRRDALPGRR